MSELPIQKIFLTATLPPYLEKPLLRKIRLPNSTLICRSLTDRPELAHHIITVRQVDKPAMDVGVNLVNALITTLRSDERIVIYTLTIDEAVKLSERLKCAVHHSGLPERGNTQAYNLFMWTSGQTPVMVATAGLIEGLNAKVRYVIVLRLAYGALSYVQESGRGGRTGERCDVFYLRDNTSMPGRYKFVEKPGMAKDLEADYYMSFYESHPALCRQITLTRCMDGEDNARSCAQIPGCQKCDVCDPEGVMHKIGLAAVHGPPLIPGSLVVENQWTRRNLREALPAPQSSSTATKQLVPPQPTTAGRKRSLDHASEDDESYGSFDVDLDEVLRIENEALRKSRGEDVETSSPKRQKVDDSFFVLPSPPMASSKSNSRAANTSNAPRSVSDTVRRSPHSAPSATRSPAPRSSGASAAGDSTFSWGGSSLSSGARQDTVFASGSASPCSARSETSTSDRSLVGRGVGLSVQLDAQVAKRNKEMRMELVVKLDGILKKLGDKCPVCWMLGGQTVDRHRWKDAGAPFTACANRKVIRDLPWGPGWLPFKKSLTFHRKHAYCYSCGMPQQRNFNREEPESHLKWSQNVDPSCRRGCPFSDIVALVMWIAFNHEPLRRVAWEHFGLDQNITQSEFVLWAMEDEEDSSRYYKGLDLFIWCVDRRMQLRS